MPESETEEDEIDDVSLLAAAKMAEPLLKEDCLVDHLEGMTSEMFGDDNEFEGDVQNEDEEVEALPDAHYGLLGSTKVLIQPQGLIDDLPEEVLRQVLCLLPAQDLYRCASLVCHRWRDIVKDPKVNQKLIRLAGSCI